MVFKAQKSMAQPNGFRNGRSAECDAHIYNPSTQRPRQEEHREFEPEWATQRVHSQSELHSESLSQKQKQKGGLPWYLPPWTSFGTGW